MVIPTATTPNTTDDTPTWLPALAESVVAPAPEPVPFPVPEPSEPSVAVAVALSPASVADPLIVANPLPPTLKFATITFNALKSCPRPDVPSHSLELQSLPQTVPFSPPEHCAAAPLADARRMKSILACNSEAAAGDWACAAEVMFAMLEALDGVAVVGREIMSARLWARARARIARKASWSVLQFPRGAQAISVRVPLVPLALPDAKTSLIEGRREAWRDVQRVRVCVVGDVRCWISALM